MQRYRWNIKKDQARYKDYKAKDWERKKAERDRKREQLKKNQSFLISERDLRKLIISSTYKSNQRKDAIPQDVTKVEDWFMSSGIAREAPCKQSVSKEALAPMHTLVCHFSI